MAIHDHTARARLSISPSGDPLTDPPVAKSRAHCATPASLRLSTLDDVALALYSLAVLCNEDERCRRTQARHVPDAEHAIWPLPPLFREGLVVAMQCLEQYARQLGRGRAMSA